MLPEHAPYQGYKAGDVIGDHDEALAYVLEHDVEALPCVAMLPPAQLAAVRFALGKMHYNHGWLVQAEAPPGALFSPLKRVIEACDVPAADVAFYFIHWLTDLAGAMPTPLRGAEQFTLRFPPAVLGSIVRTLPYVQRLAQVSGQQEKRGPHLCTGRSQHRDSGSHRAYSLLSYTHTQVSIFAVSASHRGRRQLDKADCDVSSAT